MDRVEHFARCWGSELVSLGAAGHVNTAAGLGPWPEGGRLLEALTGPDWVRYEKN